jgi:branched-chain amino acid transport system permease protein
MGVVLRGASENPDRSQTLGVNVEGVTGVAWMIAGGLSGVAAIIAATGTGIGGANTIVPYLAAAVIGGLVSIPVTALAAVTLGIVDQSVRWSVKTPGFMDGLLLAIIVVVLLVQRARTARTDTDDAGWKAAREARPIPAELRSLDVVRRWVRTLRVGGVIAVLGVPWLLSPSQINLFTVTLVYGMIAMSLLILTGWAGQISLGQFAIAGIGAYVTAVTRLPLPFSLLIGGLAGAIVAVVIGVPALRLRGLHLAISTLAFAIAVTSILLNPRYFGKALPDTLQRPSLLGLKLDDQRTFFYVTLVFLGLTVTAVIGMRRSRTARALIACRENEAAAQSFGINLLRARLGAFAISGFIAAFAGGVFAYSQYGVNASNFDFNQSIKMFLMVVIGGLGSISGPLIGAAYVGFAEIIGTNLDTVLPFFADGALGIGTVFLMLVAPGGLGELVFGMRDAMLRRVADRYRIEVPSLLADRRPTGSRAAIIPMTRPGGGTIFVPERYRAEGQWSIERRYEDALRD